MRFLIVFLLLVQAGISTRSERIEGGIITITKDSYQQATIWSLIPTVASPTNLYLSRNIQVSAGLQFIRKEPEARGQHALIFLSSAPEWIFQQDQSVFALINGKAVSLGFAVREARIKRQNVEEALRLEVSAEMFQQITTAESLSFRAGGIELIIQEKRLKAFATFARQIHQH